MVAAYSLVMQNALAPVVSGSSVAVVPCKFRTRDIVLDAEWTVRIWRSDLTRGLWFVEIHRQREGWEDSVCFKMWTCDRRGRWKFERRMCQDLPLPSHIVPKWEMVLEAHGFRHTP